MHRSLRMRAVSPSQACTVTTPPLLRLPTTPPLPPPKKKPPVPKTAAQQFKNIQVLKDIPADQLIPTMQFIAGALGVDCEFCHVEHDRDKDDKKEKQTARKMIEMELAINKSHFKNEIEVTCYTCHRRSPHPVVVPILAISTGKPPE